MKTRRPKLEFASRTILPPDVSCYGSEGYRGHILSRAFSESEQPGSFTVAPPTRRGAGGSGYHDDFTVNCVRPARPQAECLCQLELASLPFKLP